MNKSTYFSETLLLQGHIIDSLTFSKVLDRIMERNGRFTIQEIHVGQKKFERSFGPWCKCRRNPRPISDDLLKELRNLGAEVLEKEDAKLAPAPRAGCFSGRLLCHHQSGNVDPVERAMGQDAARRNGFRHSRGQENGSIRTRPFCGSGNGGDLFVVGHHGVKVVPLERPRDAALFEFMTSDASTEKPKAAFIHQIARAMRPLRKGEGKVLAGRRN